MAIKTGSSNCIRQRPRVATPGWAAFNRLHREKQSLERETDGDPFPQIASKNNQQSERVAAHCQQIKTFSSAVQIGHSILADGSSDDCGKTINCHVVGSNFASPLEALKKLHSWANEGLIQDVLAAVNNDKAQATSVLKAMSSSSNNMDDKNSVNPISAAKDYLEENSTSHSGECKLLLGNESISNTVEPEALSYPFAVPIEPEWEEDDVYLTHRRDAIKMMRAASKHSKAASNAFFRGDHVSAHQLSLKARGERAAAEMLNSKAAMEIFSHRNDTDNLWKLDLHGLHASEAVNVLKEHLFKMESMQIITSSVCADASADIMNHSHLSDASACVMDTSAVKHHASSPLRRMVLLVVTGTGNHSRGQAALPAAIRGFLIENGYRFDDARPGVIAVRPKFRFK